MTQVGSAANVAGFADSVTQGRIVDLGHELFPGMPVSATHIAYGFTLARRHGDAPRDDALSTADEILILSGHTGTHLDALGHASQDGRMHGGLMAAEVQRGGRGLRDLGIETVAPIVCRGLLLDVAALHGVPSLPPAYEVTVADLEAAVDRLGAAPSPGDVVLIRTGWGRFWPNEPDFRSEELGLPGPGPEAARWLSDAGIRATGSDTLVYEVVRPGRNVRPVHRALLVESGIYILEALNLEVLSDLADSPFLFLVAPLKLVGATASPVRPIAVLPPPPRTKSGREDVSLA